MNRRLAIVALVLALLGTYFRLAHLDRKVFWLDETHTALWISGLTRDDFLREVAEKPLFTADDLKKYRSLGDTGAGGTVRYLATVVPHHTPLYGVATSLWARAFGDSVAALRALPALVSLLGLPLVYWLAREMFESTSAAWIAVGLFAVSPFHVLYAQEARPYSFWTVATLLSSVALVRAMRLGTWKSFAIYAGTVVVGLYAYLLFAFVLAGHALYVLAAEGLRITRTGIRFLVAATVGAVAFAPWLVVIVENLRAVRKQMRWVGEPPEAGRWLETAARTASVAFVDPGFGHVFTFVPVLVLVTWALVVLWRSGSRCGWAFVMALIVPLALTLLPMDLFLGGRRVGVTRYFVPAHLGGVLAVAGALALRLETAEARRRLGLGLGAVLLVASGLVSCALSYRAETWWNKGRGTPEREMARMMNRTARPLLWAPAANMGDVISLSYDFGDGVRVLFADEGDLGEIPEGVSEVFALKPTRPMQKQLRRLGYVLTQAHERDFWLVARR